MLAPTLAAIRRERPELAIHLWAQRDACCALRLLGLIDSHLDFQRGLRMPDDGHPVDGLVAFDWQWESLSDVMAQMGIKRFHCTYSLCGPHASMAQYSSRAIQIVTGSLTTIDFHEQIAPRDVILSFNNSLRAAFAGRLVVAPGGGAYGLKKDVWRFFKPVAQRLAAEGWPVAIIEGKDDNYSCGVPLINVSFPELALGLGEAAGVLANDSAVGHLAALLGVPTVTVFGAANFHMWQPVGPWRESVQLCAHSEQDNQFLRLIHNCYAELTPEVLYDALTGLVARRATVTKAAQQTASPVN